MKAILCSLLLSVSLAAAPPELASKRADRDIASDLDPNSAFWSGVPAVFATANQFGHVVDGHRTEVRSRWTKEFLYFLFVCPYGQLHLKPSPQTATETNLLWNWDVAEVFVGADSQNIRHYREYEVSPQGEWIDLDVDLSKPHPQDGWVWNSGFQNAVRVDSGAKTWYCFMKIPYASIDSRTPAPNLTLRANFYRSQGPDHKSINWQPTGKGTFHVPESFGLIRLVE